MGWLEGWLSGFSDRHREYEKENLAQAQAALEREGAIYKVLLTSDNPAIRTAAVTGLLGQARPMRRKSGLAGWMGEMESDPLYPTLMKYINTPQVLGVTQEPDIVTTPEQAGYKPTMPAAKPGTAAMSPVQTTAPGAPGPAQQQQFPSPPPSLEAVRDPFTPPPQYQAPEGYDVTAGHHPSLRLGAGEDRGTPFADLRSNLAPYLQPATPPPPLVQPGARHEITGLPPIWMSDQEKAMMAGRTKVMAEVLGMADVIRQANPAISIPEATKQAWEAYQTEHGRVTTPYQSQMYEWTDPSSGQKVRGLGSYNRATNRRQLDSGLPMPADAVMVTSALTPLDMYERSRASAQGRLSVPINYQTAYSIARQKLPYATPEEIDVEATRLQAASAQAPPVGSAFDVGGGFLQNLTGGAPGQPYKRTPPLGLDEVLRKYSPDTEPGAAKLPPAV